MKINGENILLTGPCSMSGNVYVSDLSGKSSNTGKSYSLRVTRFQMIDPGNGIGSSSNNTPRATLTETDDVLSKIETVNPITINPQFSLVHVDDSNEDVIYLYSRISNVPQIDVKNDTTKSASYRFISLSSDQVITNIDLSKSDFVKFSLEPEESIGARYFIFDDDKLNMFVYGKNYSWLQAQKTFKVKIAANTYTLIDAGTRKERKEPVDVEQTFKLDHAPQEILGVDVDDSTASDLVWSSVHLYIENNKIKIQLASVINAESTAKYINVIVNYAWQQEI